MRHVHFSFSWTVCTASQPSRPGTDCLVTCAVAVTGSLPSSAPERNEVHAPLRGLLQKVVEQVSGNDPFHLGMHGQHVEPGRAEPVQERLDNNPPGCRSGPTISS